MLQQAQLFIPAFTKGKDQLYLVDIEKTGEIANVRIHVKRVIGLLRRKAILPGIVLIDFLMSNPNGSKEEATPVIDRVINLSTALVNLCPRILPLD